MFALLDVSVQCFAQSETRHWPFAHNCGAGLSQVEQCRSLSRCGHSSVDEHFKIQPQLLANFDGTDTFICRVTDGLNSSPPVTVSFTTSSVNDAPVAVDDLYVVTNSNALVVTAEAGLLANDRDIDSTALTVVMLSSPGSGTLTLRPDGSFDFVPGAGESRTVTFTYQVTDGSATSAAATVTFNITVGQLPGGPGTGTGTGPGTGGGHSASNAPSGRTTFSKSQLDEIPALARLPQSLVSRSKVA